MNWDCGLFALFLLNDSFPILGNFLIHIIIMKFHNSRDNQKILKVCRGNKRMKSHILRTGTQNMTNH